MLSKYTNLQNLEYQGVSSRAIKSRLDKENSNQNQHLKKGSRVKVTSQTFVRFQV